MTPGAYNYENFATACCDPTGFHEPAAAYDRDTMLASAICFVTFALRTAFVSIAGHPIRADGMLCEQARIAGSWAVRINKTLTLRRAEVSILGPQVKTETAHGDLHGYTSSTAPARNTVRRISALAIAIL
jgi:hypothetical protein